MATTLTDEQALEALKPLLQPFFEAVVSGDAPDITAPLSVEACAKLTAAGGSAKQFFELKDQLARDQFPPRADTPPVQARG